MLFVAQLGQVDVADCRFINMAVSLKKLMALLQPPQVSDFILRNFFSEVPVTFCANFKYGVAYSQRVMAMSTVF